MTLSRLVSALAVLLALFTVGACGGDDSESAAGDSAAKKQESGPFVIGQAIALTGPYEPFDGPPAVATAMAIEKVNAEGGVLGRRIRTVQADDKSTPEGSALAGREVIEKGADFVITECDFDIGGPAARVANDDEIVAFSSCAGSEKFGVQGIGPYAFTMGTVTPTEGAVGAEWAYESQGWRRPYVLADQEIEYSKSQCEYFEERWTGLAGGDSLAGEDTFKNSDASIAAQITRIKTLDEEPDFLVLCTFTPGGTSVIKQLRGAGIDIPVLTGYGMDGDYWLESVPGLKDVFITAFASMSGDDPDPRVNEFVEEYTKREGEPPPASFALTGYAIVEALQIAAERAGTLDGPSIKAALEQFDQEQLILGPTTFTEDYHFALDRPMAIVEVQRGKLKYVEDWKAKEVPEPKF